jgi:hypothetical protein
MKRVLSLITGMLAIVATATAQAPVRNISGNLTGINNWSADTIYKLTGKVYVKAGGTLNIAPGTIIKGDKSTPGSALIVCRGGQIYAIGEATRPIVFTSSETPGNRAMGDWGGLVIAGNARINVPGGIGTFEGGNLANPDGNVSDGQYGGLNDLDNSGELRYVRIEYAGFAYAPNSELNSLTLGGVGSGTKINYVQCSYGLDDHFEWFGGKADAKYLISFRGNDDDFDTDFGFSGKVQFGVCLRDTAVADAVSGAMGFESDNDGAGSANGPKTRPVFSNMTIIGPRFTPTTTFDPNFRRAAHIRRNSELSAFNSIFMGWPTGIKIDGDSCQRNADSARIRIKNSVVAGCPLSLDSTATTTSWGISNWYNQAANSNTIYTANTDVQLSNPFNYNNPDFRPAAGSPMLSGASFTDAFLATGFTTVAFRGAFGTENWTAGWSNFRPDTVSYTTGYFPLSITNTQVNAPEMTLYPNPAQNDVALAITMPESQNITVVVRNVQGQVLNQQTINANKGFQRIVLGTQTLANGLYLVETTGTGWKHTQKLNVAH